MSIFIVCARGYHIDMWQAGSDLVLGVLLVGAAVSCTPAVVTSAAQQLRCPTDQVHVVETIPQSKGHVRHVVSACGEHLTFACHRRLMRTGYYQTNCECADASCPDRAAAPPKPIPVEPAKSPHRAAPRVTVESSPKPKPKELRSAVDLCWDATTAKAVIVAGRPVHDLYSADLNKLRARAKELASVHDLPIRVLPLRNVTWATPESEARMPYGPHAAMVGIEAGLVESRAGEQGDMSRRSTTVDHESIAGALETALKIPGTVWGSLDAQLSDSRERTALASQKTQPHLMVCGGLAHGRLRTPTGAVLWAQEEGPDNVPFTIEPGVYRLESVYD